MQTLFYVSLNGGHVGPYSVETIVQKIEAGEHVWTDYVYCEAKADWVMMMEHPSFVDKFQSSSTKASENSIGEHTVINAAAPKHDDKFKDKAWYILKEGNNYGPFSKLELVQMLQEKTLFEYDYIWHSKLNAWKRIAELEEYSADAIRAMKESGLAEVAEVFFRRRHARASYGCSLIVHNNKTVFKGRSMEISSGGAGILIDNPNLQPGQNLFLHFQPGDGVPPFNAVCTVVSKQMVNNTKSALESVRYGVKFTSISQSVRESIRQFAQKVA
ncbi:MAG: GYF domain-containing protein [Pseudobdellovibrionaceae bacterium]